MTIPQSTAEMPAMMYGTAWKKERTADLVYQAIKAGFRGIDTAAMKRHYDEVGTGEGIRRAIREGICTRKDLFIQTKFTPVDNTSAYSPADPIPAQIHASITSSLANLFPTDPSDHTNGSGGCDGGKPYLDALILHSPFPTTQQTLEAWNALQAYLPAAPRDPSSSSSGHPRGQAPDDDPRAGTILRLGISNITLPVLRALASAAGTVLPQIVQNRFRAAERAWDADVRAWCAERAVSYQAFWTLTANGAVWRQQRAGFVADVARGAGVSPAGAWYALLMLAAGLVVLNGTTDPAHMREDLEVLERVRRWRETAEGREVWGRCATEFGRLVGGGVVDQGGNES
ncbi:hypothetical protein MYCTH_2312612 [Thermothelomyces thermophilus ATCC 42464]|uniref:NADP-dependent oxidoreductase domain-containing protein n=1 Tax=Thermothelomyces thermophilus (strain ATCC 42464 / BCRC 31852 / DSM 1799) TaxID=573729 RepID=G2QN14_THET4|nr:uncharacterized protein MYCTH_2312612 [Thermothelomyces thermophilus ATCC 42464]AEO61887.1 hypothetical protein MYCTH_2312612 [Thermothelomyces thermophilus ATCC 42464]